MNWNIEYKSVFNFKKFHSRLKLERKMQNNYPVKKDIDNQLICHLVGFLWQQGPPQRATGGGSILVFLPGFHEIRQLGEELINHFSHHGIDQFGDFEF